MKRGSYHKSKKSKNNKQSGCADCCLLNQRQIWSVHHLSRAIFSLPLQRMLRNITGVVTRGHRRNNSARQYDWQFLSSLCLQARSRKHDSVVKLIQRNIHPWKGLESIRILCGAFLICQALSQQFEVVDGGWLVISDEKARRRMVMHSTRQSWYLTEVCGSNLPRRPSQTESSTRNSKVNVTKANRVMTSLQFIFLFKKPSCVRSGENLWHTSKRTPPFQR